MRAGRARQARLRVHEHHRAGDRRGALYHPGGQCVEGGFHSLTHGQARGDSGQGRDALFQHPEGLDALSDVPDDIQDSLSAAVGDYTSRGLDVHQRTVLAAVSPLTQKAASFLQDEPEVVIDALWVIIDEVVNLDSPRLPGTVA